MSDRIETQGEDWAAAYQRQTFVTGKAIPLSHQRLAPLFSRNFSHR